MVTYFTLQVQVFTKYGQFIRKFGADILQHPRGVTTDNCGRIIVVECKVMRVVIFDMVGNVLNKFSCSRYVFTIILNYYDDFSLSNIELSMIL